MKKNNRFLMKILKKYIVFFIFLLLTGISLAYIEIFVIKKGGSVIDSLTLSKDMITLQSRLKQFLFLLVISLIMQLLIGIIFALLRKKAIFYAQSLVFKHLLYLRPDIFYKYKKGDLSERISSNIQSIKSFFDQSLLQSVQSASFMVFSVYFLYKIHPRFAGIYIGYLIFALFVSFLYAAFVQKIYYKYYSVYAEQSSFIIENLNGFISIKTLINSLEFIYGRFLKLLEKTTKRMFIADIALFFSLLLYVIVLGGFIFISLMVGSKMVYAGDMTVGQLISALVILYSASNNFNRVNNSISHLKSSLAALKRTEEFMSEPQESISVDKLSMKRFIKMVDVFFAYDKGSCEYILQNINLRIEKGDFIGIKGATGEGKTTLLYLLAGILFPTKGKFFVDDIELTPQNILAYRKIIGFLPQEPFIIDGTLKENITFGSRFDKERFHRVVREAGLEDFFAKYGADWEMKLKESGKNLSQGEKQRIHLARVLYQEPQIYLFDEPTSSVDEVTERIIISTIKKLHDRGKTVIIVSHKPAPFKFAERIFELKEGKLTEVDKRRFVDDKIVS